MAMEINKKGLHLHAMPVVMVVLAIMAVTVLLAGSPNNLGPVTDGLTSSVLSQPEDPRRSILPAGSYTITQF